MEIDQPARSFAPRITLYLVLDFFSIPHLIDDFLFDTPAEFGISVHLTQFLAGVFILIYLGILIPMARGKRGGAIGAMGMRAKPPTAEWGAMLSTANQNMRQSPMLAIAPGLAIMITVLAINFVGDALRDALDPRVRS